jgi:hypothetical protein
MSFDTNVSDLATRVASELKSHKVLINGNVANLSALTTTAKSNLVAAINEVAAGQAQAGAQIDDVTPSTSKVYSSSKTNSQIAAAVSNLVASSPAALDTLNELAAALGNDANFATTVNTALGNRLRVDVNNQGLTGTQQSNGRTNLDVYSKAEIGSVTTNYVATFEAGLV